MACTSDTNSIHLAINPDGSLAASAILDPAGDNALQVSAAGLKVPSSALGFPVGAVIPWGGASIPPDGWLIANGSAVSRATYAALFAVIGTRYGIGDGASTFNLPPAWVGDRLWDYQPLTATVTGINATTEGAANLVLAGNSVVYDGSEVRVEAYFPEVQSVGGVVNATGVWLRDGTVIGQFHFGSVATGYNFSINDSFREVPPAGAHVYSLKAFVNTLSLNVVAGAQSGSGINVNGYLRVLGSHTHLIKI